MSVLVLRCLDRGEAEVAGDRGRSFNRIETNNEPGAVDQERLLELSNARLSHPDRLRDGVSETVATRPPAYVRSSERRRSTLHDPAFPGSWISASEQRPGTFVRAHRHFGGIDSAERPGRGLNAVSSTAQPGALFADETTPRAGYDLGDRTPRRPGRRRGKDCRSLLAGRCGVTCKRRWVSSWCRTHRRLNWAAPEHYVSFWGCPSKSP